MRACHLIPPKNNMLNSTIFKSQSKEKNRLHGNYGAFKLKRKKSAGQNPAEIFLAQCNIEYEIFLVNMSLYALHKLDKLLFALFVAGEYAALLKYSGKHGADLVLKD